MPASATLIGVLLGFGTQVYSNALRKLPLMRHPWEHVVGMGLGVVFTNQLVKWDAQLQVDLDKLLDKAKAANERRYFEEERLLMTPKWRVLLRTNGVQSQMKISTSVA